MSAPVALLRRAQLQAVARHRRNDPTFPWREWARAVVNEALSVPDIAPCAATSIAYGRRAPYRTVAEVPAATLAEVEAGVAEALARGRVPSDGASLGRAVHMTPALREELRAWLIWPEGWRRSDLEARAKARRDERRARDRAQKDARRRADGKMTRVEYLESAALKRRACTLAGISLRTFDRRDPEEQERLTNAVRVTLGESPSADNRSLSYLPAEQLAPKRYSLAEQARELGLSPGALRVRRHREKKRAALSAAPRIVSGALATHARDMSPERAFADFLDRAGLRLHPEARARALADLKAHVECFGDDDGLDDDVLAGLAEMWRFYPASPEEIERMEAA